MPNPSVVSDQVKRNTVERVSDDWLADLPGQVVAFRECKFLAMPIAGALAWALIGVANLFWLNSIFARQMSIYFGTGFIFYLGLIVSRWTGEDLLGKQRPSNWLDRIFLATTVQAVAVYSIAIPFALVEPESLPLSVGILTGLMWIPFSVLVGHWLGWFHTLTRTALILWLWYALPDWRYVAIPAAIVAVYLVTLALLWQRYQARIVTL